MNSIEHFRINRPYGLELNSNGEWMIFNREYMPLSWGQFVTACPSLYKTSPNSFQIFKRFPNLTDDTIKKIAGIGNCQLDKQGKIWRVFLYDDATNPSTFPKFLDVYDKKIKSLSDYGLW